MMTEKIFTIDEIYATKEEIINACSSENYIKELSSLIIDKIIDEDLLIYLLENLEYLTKDDSCINSIVSYIIKFQVLSESFIRKYIVQSFHEFANLFSDLIAYQNLSENFINEYRNKFFITKLLYNQELSEDFIINLLNEIISSSGLIFNSFSYKFFKLDKYIDSYKALLCETKRIVGRHQNVTERLSNNFDITRNRCNLIGLSKEEKKKILIEESNINKRNLSFFDDYIIGYTSFLYYKYNLKFKCNIGSDIISRSPVKPNLFDLEFINWYNKNYSYQNRSNFFLMTKVNYKDIISTDIIMSRAKIINIIDTNKFSWRIEK